MVQSLNTKAILALASVVRRPSLLAPLLSVENISQVNYTALHAVGIRAVMFDKDNTLTAPYDNSIHPVAAQGLQSALQVFGRDKVAVLSNSAGTLDDPDGRDAAAIEESLGISVIRHEEKKPGGLAEVLSHFDLTDPSALCMVGDRVLTDIVFGNLHGMLTVHTLPLCKGSDNVKDNWTAKLLRPMENAVLYGKGGKLLTRRAAPHKLWPGAETCPLLLASSSTADQPPECNEKDTTSSSST